MDKAVMHQSFKLYIIRKKDAEGQFIAGLLIPAVFSILSINSFLNNLINSQVWHYSDNFIDSWIIWSIIVVLRNIASYREDNKSFSMYPADNVSRFTSFSLLQYRQAALIHVAGLLFYLVFYAIVWWTQSGNESMVLAETLIPAQFLADMISAFLLQFAMIGTALLYLALKVRFGGVVTLAGILLLPGVFFGVILKTVIGNFLSLWIDEPLFPLFLLKMISTWAVLTGLALWLSERSIYYRDNSERPTKKRNFMITAILLITSIVVWSWEGYQSNSTSTTGTFKSESIIDKADSMIELDIDSAEIEILFNESELYNTHFNWTVAGDVYSPDGKIYIYYELPAEIHNGIDILAYQERRFTADYEDGELTLNYDIVTPNKQVLRISGYKLFSFYRESEYSKRFYGSYLSSRSGNIWIIVPEGVRLIEAEQDY